MKPKPPIIDLFMPDSSPDSAIKNRQSSALLKFTVALAFCLVAGLAIAPKGTRYAVIFAPDSKPEAAIRFADQTGSLLVSLNASGTVAIFENQNPNPTFSFFKAGAWFVLDASIVAACIDRKIV